MSCVSLSPFLPFSSLLRLSHCMESMRSSVLSIQRNSLLSTHSLVSLSDLSGTLSTRHGLSSDLSSHHTLSLPFGDRRRDPSQYSSPRSIPANTSLPQYGWKRGRACTGGHSLMGNQSKWIRVLNSRSTSLSSRLLS